MPHTSLQAEANSLSASETTPCPGCGTELSRYISKCPSCGRHAHRLSHDEILKRRERQQKWIIVGGTMAACLLIAALLWFVNSGMNSLLSR